MKVDHFIKGKVIEGKVIDANVQHKRLVEPAVFVRLKHPWVREARGHSVVLIWERADWVEQVGMSMMVICERC